MFNLRGVHKSGKQLIGGSIVLFSSLIGYLRNQLTHFRQLGYDVASVQRTYRKLEPCNSTNYTPKILNLWQFALFHLMAYPGYGGVSKWNVTVI